MKSHMLLLLHAQSWKSVRKSTTTWALLRRTGCHHISASVSSWTTWAVSYAHTSSSLSTSCLFYSPADCSGWVVPVLPTLSHGLPTNSSVCQAWQTAQVKCYVQGLLSHLLVCPWSHVYTYPGDWSATWVSYTMAVVGILVIWKTMKFVPWAVQVVLQCLVQLKRPAPSLETDQGVIDQGKWHHPHLAWRLIRVSVISTACAVIS